jgi:hypothetical protein
MHPLSKRDQVPPSTGSGLPPPPGVAGDIAKFAFQTLERQVPEVAILTALGLLAGFCGKAFVVAGDGLNIRVVFIAEDCVAENALERGIVSIVSAVSKSYPEITRFVDSYEYSNGPALTKALSAQPSFLNLVGDIGSNLDGMTTSKNDRMAALQHAMQHRDTTTCSGYSLISRTTPRSIRKTLTASVLGSDFIHTFMMVECSRVQPPVNKRTDHPLADVLREQVVKLCEVATGNRACNSPTSVAVDAEASLFLDTFNSYCDSVITSSDDDVTHRIWNNAHGNSLRVAALLAVADDCKLPIVKVQHAEWAREFVLHGIGFVSRHNVVPHKPRNKRTARG